MGKLARKRTTNRTPLLVLTWTVLQHGLVGMALGNFSKSAGQPFSYGAKFAGFLILLQTLILKGPGWRPLNADQRILFKTWAELLWDAGQTFKSKKSKQV